MRRTRHPARRPHRNRRGSAVNPLLLSLAITFVLGCVAGSLLVPGLPWAEAGSGASACSWVRCAISSRWQDVLSQGVLAPLAILLGLYGCSFSGIGVPFCYLFLAVQGVSTGLTGGYLYFYHGVSGAVFNLLILLMPTVLCAGALLLFARNCAGVSYLVCKDLFWGEKEELGQPFRRLTHSLGVATALIVASAVLKLLSFWAFSSYIQV
ncbi:hypothetical protein LJB68_05185 [bacterium 210820-DFI.6.52]|uniref:hypothetical protein n=1 Tax=Bittarella massiliensis (ex Durand et al. 2017) TaxID=1720313 RepID=UPI000B002E1E|nr:hypothetical protein [Bittarella massiliensis (ex Durand et al. 2017)]MCB5940958.1 hypothetical protein [bacterium 210820-DFI.6.52]